MLLFVCYGKYYSKDRIIIQKAFYTKLNIMRPASERKNMLPQHIPVIEGKEAEEFIAQDKKRLSTAEKTNLEKCRAIYRKNPIK
jgi:hypothetical protein